MRGDPLGGLVGGGQEARQGRSLADEFVRHTRRLHELAGGGSEGDDQAGSSPRSIQPLLIFPPGAHVARSSPRR